MIAEESFKKSFIPQSIFIIGWTILINNSTNLIQQKTISFHDLLTWFWPKRTKARLKKTPKTKSNFKAISSLYTAVTSCKKLETYASIPHKLKKPHSRPVLGPFSPKKTSKEKLCQNNYTQFLAFILLELYAKNHKNSINRFVTKV